MLLPRTATLIVQGFVELALMQTPCKALSQQFHEERSVQKMAVQDAPPQSCPVTLPSEAIFVLPYPDATSSAAHFGLAADGRFGTEKLWTVLPIDGIWRGPIPSKPGDFAYSNKLPWFRVHPAFLLKDGPLTITGKRLDGPAPSFTETYQGGGAFPDDDDNAMIMGGIEIPVFGCWEIKGHYKDQELSFIVWVTPLAEQKSPPVDSSPEIVQPPVTSYTEVHRIHVDGDVQARSLVYRVTPEIPHEAQVANVSGTVVLHAVINRDGRASELQYLSGPPLLTKAAIDAVTWWRYMVTGDSVEVDTTIQVAFP
jgi:TonB-like protein